MVSLGDSPILKPIACVWQGQDLQSTLRCRLAPFAIGSPAAAVHEKLLWGCSYCVSYTGCPLQGGEHT